jgi:hypothetical protein
MKPIFAASNAAVQYEKYVMGLAYGLRCQHVSDSGLGGCYVYYLQYVLSLGGNFSKTKKKNQMNDQQAISYNKVFDVVTQCTTTP